MSRLCSDHNFTIKWSSYIPSYQSNFFYEEKGRPKGFYARYYLEKIYLDKLENTYEKCLYIFTDKIGDYIKSNKSYDGSIGLITQSKADISIRPFDFYMKESDQIDFSTIFTSFQYLALQVVEKNNLIKKQISFENFLINFLPSINFLLFLLSSSLIYLLCLLLIPIYFRIANFNFFNEINNCLKTRFKFAKILTFSYLFFLFLMYLIYSSSLNMSMMIVDTNYFLDSYDKILKTTKEPCFMENSSELQIFEFADKDSLAYHIYNKRNKGDTCFFSSNEKMPNILKRNEENIFVVIIDFAKHITLKSIQYLTDKDTYLNEQPLFEIYRTFIMRKNLEQEIKNVINRSINFLLTHGFVKYLNDNIPEFDFIMTKQKRVNFKLSDYIKENTIVGQLNYSTFIYIFKVQFYLNLISFLIFMFYHISNFIKLIQNYFLKFKFYIYNLFN